MNAQNSFDTPQKKKCRKLGNIGIAVGLLLLLVGVYFTMHVMMGSWRHIAESDETPIPSEIANTISDMIAYAWCGAWLSLAGVFLFATSLFVRWKGKK